MGKASFHGWTRRGSHHHVDETLGEIERASNSLHVKEVARFHISREFEHVFDVDAWLNSVAKIVAESGQHYVSGEKLTIHRVPEDIRCRDSKAFEPHLVCIGPYRYSHRGSETLRAMQDHKWRCVRCLVGRGHGGVHEPEGKAVLDECMKRMTTLDEEVRQCYGDEIAEGSYDLALMMVLDGCFILDLLLKHYREQEEEGVNYSEDDNDAGVLLGRQRIWNQVKYDLLLVENQIPFFVLQNLFDILKTPGDEGLDLGKLAVGIFASLMPDQGKHTPASSVQNANHIHHLLHLFYLSIIPMPPCSPSSPKALRDLPEWISSATELRNMGVEFKARKDAASFLDIAFNGGVMEIPTVEVHEYSNCLFRNLIAFEQCLPEPHYYITAYTAFMDCIIHRAKDVRLLNQKNILHNRRGTDEEVAVLFSRLCNQVHYGPDDNYLKGVLVDVAKYREAKWRKWRKQWSRHVCDYLKNPVAVISIATGLFLLITGITQTFFAAYSYFLPPR